MRYILGTKDHYQHIFELPEGQTAFVHVLADASWAPLAGDRRSVSGCVLKLSSFEKLDSEAATLFVASRLQEPIAQSSGEAELYALSWAVQQGYYLRTVLQELELYQTVHVVGHCDSMAAIQNTHRQGLGRMRHLELRWLWLQAEVQRKRLVLVKILGTENPADGATKPLQGYSFYNHRTSVGVMDSSYDAPMDCQVNMVRDELHGEPEVEPDRGLFCPNCFEGLVKRQVVAADFPACGIADPNFLVNVYFCRN